MSDDLRIRPYQLDDLDELIDLFAGSVREVASRDYTSDQIAAWAPVAISYKDWAERLAGRPTYVAVIGDEIVGFSDLEPDGHIDMLYVHSRFQRRGVARALLTHIQAQAGERGISRLFTEASVTAKPVFERYGFEVIAAQEVELRGQRLRNFRMAKEL